MCSHYKYVLARECCPYIYYLTDSFGLSADIIHSKLFNSQEEAENVKRCTHFGEFYEVKKVKLTIEELKDE